MDLKVKGRNREPPLKVVVDTLFYSVLPPLFVIMPLHFN